MNLLIVNDETITLRGLSQKVEWKQYGISSVFTALSAKEAMLMMEQEEIDIVLCDIEMPNQNGIELIRKISEEGFDCECVILTCHANFAYAQEALQLGVRDYLLLPSPYEAVGQAVKEAMERLEKKRHDQDYLYYGQVWLNNYKQMASGEKKQTPAQIAEQTAEYILSHLNDPVLSVKSLAGIFYLNPIYLNRIFRKERSISISQFIIQERLKLCARLLEDPSLSLAAIAESIGYTSYPSFSAIFKKVYHCTPTQFREKLNQKKKEQ